MRIKVYKVESESGDVFINTSIDVVTAELESIDVDDNTNVTYKVTITTMDKEEYNNLPEFNF